MRKTTATIRVVELTPEEEHTLWVECRQLGSKEAFKKYGIKMWCNNDGNNELLFEGEDIFRPIVRPGRGR